MNQEELIKQTIESVLSGGSTLQDMNLRTANALIGRVQEKAREMGIPVVAAVSDKAGRWRCSAWTARISEVSMWR